MGKWNFIFTIIRFPISKIFHLLKSLWIKLLCFLYCKTSMPSTLIFSQGISGPFWYTVKSNLCQQFEYMTFQGIYINLCLVETTVNFVNFFSAKCIIYANTKFLHLSPQLIMEIQTQFFPRCTQDSHYVYCSNFFFLYSPRMGPWANHFISEILYFTCKMRNWVRQSFRFLWF